MSSDSRLRRLNLAQPPFEKPLLTVVGDQLQRASVVPRRLLEGPPAAQQIGTSRMQQVITIESAARCERIDKCQPGLWTLHHGNCNGPVQRHDRRGLGSLEKIVQPDNLAPVRILGPSCPTMLGRNRRLQREGTRPSAKRLLDQRPRFGDLLLVPAATIL